MKKEAAILVIVGLVILALIALAVLDVHKEGSAENTQQKADLAAEGYINLHNISDTLSSIDNSLQYLD